MNPSDSVPAETPNPDRLDNISGIRVAGELASERLMRSLDNRLTSEPKPTRKQVGMVLHALADHTAIMAALEYCREPDGLWPEATSIGRWLHDVGDTLEER